MRWTIGITGTPGSGKSTALRGFARLGWRVLDADELCAEVYRRNRSGICQRLQRRWGAGVLDGAGQPDRRAVARIVFGDAEERRWLERLVHPLVRELALALVRGERGPTAFAVPLLYEAGWEGDFQAVAAVWTEPGLRRRRLRRRGWSDAEIRLRDAAQQAGEEKLERADFGLINHGRPQELWQQCRLVAEQFHQNPGKPRKTQERT